MCVYLGAEGMYVIRLRYSFYMIVFVFRKNETGYWASDGCVLLNSDENKTVCQCDHLTNFAVLMSPFVEVCNYRN